jgi:hypothetical protein
VHQYLSGHPAVSALQEELACDPFFTEGLSTFTHELPGTEVEKVEGRRALFNILTEPGRTPQTEACGVKCAFGHGVQGNRFTEVVQREFPEAKIIHVVRQDKVAQYGSFCRARSSGTWHQKEGDGETQTSKRTLDPHRFVSYVLDIHDVNASLRRLRETHDTLTVEYESDILNGQLRTNERLFSLVGVQPKEATWLNLRKVSPAPEAYISNYDNLRGLQRKIEGQLDAGHTTSHLRKKHAPPFLKSLYRSGKYWVDHPGYAAYKAGKAVKKILNVANNYASRL